MTDLHPPYSILLVDDSPGDRALYRHLLAEAGSGAFVTIETGSGAEALARAAQAPPDCILLDYRLPDIDGLQFLAKLSQQSPHGCAPVIMLSGYGSETVVIDAVHAGAADYLPKNGLTGSALRRAIDNAIEKQKLREALEAQRSTLEQTNADLFRRNQEFQSFYHAVSHELKTPLTSAREFVSIVLDSGELDETHKEYLRIARKSCDKMRIVINDLVDASRIDTGKLSIVPRRDRIVAVIAQVVASLTPSARGAGVELTQAIVPELPQVLFDGTRIQQVLINLLSNAIKFTPQGGTVTITADRDPADRDAVGIAVSDTGRGIAPEHLDRIFERHYQTAEDDAAVNGGLGLGLFISQNLIKLHGSRIEVESALGKGSRFCFRLFSSIRDPLP